MTVKFRHWKVPGIYPRDLCRHLGVNIRTIKKYCRQLNIDLLELDYRTLNPFSQQQAHRIMALHYKLRGEQFLKQLESTTIPAIGNKNRLPQ